MRWWQSRNRNDNVERELHADRDQEEEQERERGVPPEEPRHAARRAFGNPTLISEQIRAVWSWNGLENLFRDLRISLRTLFRPPGVSMIPVLVIPPSIGPPTSLFPVIPPVLPHPPPIPPPAP